MKFTKIIITGILLFSNFFLYSQTFESAIYDEVSELQSIKDSIYKIRNYEESEIVKITTRINYLNKLLEVIHEKNKSIDSIKSKVNNLKLVNKLELNVLIYKNLRNKKDKEETVYFYALRPDKIEAPYEEIKTNKEKWYTKEGRVLNKILKEIDLLNNTNNKYKWSLIKVKKDEMDFLNVSFASIDENNVDDMYGDYYLLYELDMDFINSMNKIIKSYEGISELWAQNTLDITDKKILHECNRYELNSEKKAEVDDWWNQYVYKFIYDICNDTKNYEQDTIIFDIYIDGYASPDGSIKHNKELSKKRANAVKSHMESLILNLNGIGNIPENIFFNIHPKYFGEEKTPPNVLENSEWESLPLDKKKIYLNNCRVAIFYAKRDFRYKLKVL